MRTRNKDGSKQARRKKRKISKTVFSFSCFSDLLLKARITSRRKNIDDANTNFNIKKRGKKRERERNPEKERKKKFF